MVIRLFRSFVLGDTIFSADLSKVVPKLDIPFEVLQAPVKGFYTFEQSAHSPMFEEPEKMQKILREDVLAGTNTLADLK